MPTRILRDGILGSERVNRLDWGAEVFYRRLMSVVDDYGRYPADPRLLRAALYALRVDEITLDQITRWLSECEELVQIYEAAGKRFLQVLDFGQRTRSKPKYPGPEDDRNPRPSAATRGHPPQPAAIRRNPRQPAGEDVVGDGDVDGGGDVGERARAAKGGTPPQTAALVLSKPSGFDNTSEPDLFQRFWNLFIAAGVALNDRDKERALRLWLNYEKPEHEQIIHWVIGEMKTTWTDAKHTPRPASALESKGWTRTASPRIISSPPKASDKGDEVMHRMVQRAQERAALKKGPQNA